MLAQGRINKNAIRVQYCDLTGRLDRLRKISPFPEVHNSSRIAQLEEELECPTLSWTGDRVPCLVEHPKVVSHLVEEPEVVAGEGNPLGTFPGSVHYRTSDQDGVGVVKAHQRQQPRYGCQEVAHLR